MSNFNIDKIKKEITSLLKKNSDELIDNLFFLPIKETENELLNSSYIYGEEAYIQKSLRPSALFTSYQDYFQILNQLEKLGHKSLIDCGAGYGRASLLAQLFFPEIEVYSLELVSERIEKGKQAALALGLETKYFCKFNLFSDLLPKSDVYFIYLPTGKLLKHIFNQIFILAKIHPITLVVIESHGDLVQTIKRDYPWCQSSEGILKTHQKRHDQTIYLFQTLSPDKLEIFEKDLNFWKQNIQSHLESNDEFPIQEIPKNLIVPLLRFYPWPAFTQLVIEDQDINSKEAYLWISDLLGIEYSQSAKFDFQLKNPDRMITLDQIKKIMIPKKPYLFWIQERADYGEIRKIIINPRPFIENSKGERTPLDFEKY